MLSPEQRSEFETRGFIRIPDVFTRSEAATMEERLWVGLHRKHGVRREDPASWALPAGVGLQSLRTHSSFDPIDGPALHAALDGLIGTGSWKRPKHWGQLLVSFPVRETAPRTWKAGWHTDFPYFLPADRLLGALVFCFIGEVPAQTGGTLVLSGSHRVIARFLERKPQLRKVKMKVTRQALMNSDPWLKGIHGEFDAMKWREGLGGAEHRVGEVPVRIEELTGEPGDVVIGHPWLLHTGAPNFGDRPRFMRVQRVRHRGLVAAHQPADLESVDSSE